MNAIAKVLAPAALVFASFSAGAAGLVETDYPFDAPAAAQASAMAPAAGQAYTGLDIHYPGDSAAVSSDRQRSRAEVMSEIGQTGATQPFGTGHNA